jgi:hypothetical protein
MKVIDDRARLVTADSAGVQDPIPEFGVAGTAGCTDVETLVESTNLVEHLPAKSHIGAGADLPGRAASLPGLGIEYRAKIPPLEAAAEAPHLLENALRLGFQFARKDKSGNRPDFLRVECILDSAQPGRVQNRVIVRIGDNVAARSGRASVARNVQAGPIFPYVGRAVALDHLTGFIGA